MQGTYLNLEAYPEQWRQHPVRGGNRDIGFSGRSQENVDAGNACRMGSGQLFGAKRVGDLPDLALTWTEEGSL